MSEQKEKIITSQRLKEETEKEFGTTIIESNGGDTRYSSRDDSYSSVVDFFVKVFKSGNSDTTNDEMHKSAWSKQTSKEKNKSLVLGLIITVILGLFVALMFLGGGRLGIIIGVLVVFAAMFVLFMVKKKFCRKKRKTPGA